MSEITTNPFSKKDEQPSPFSSRLNIRGREEREILQKKRSFEPEAEPPNKEAD